MSNPSVKRVERFFGAREHALRFEQVRDPRKRRGRRWASRTLLAATFIAMFAMERTLRGLERMTAQLGGRGRRFGITRRLPDSTAARYFSRLRDEAGLRRVLVDDIRRAERRKALEPTRLPINLVAIDGKTIWCGPKAVDDPACQAMPQDDERGYYRLHTLHAVLVSAAAQPCIDQMLVPKRTNEMGVFARFFKRLVKTYGRSRRLEVISIDAGMVSAQHAKLIAGALVGYIMALKDTQPTLLAEAKRLLGAGKAQERRKAEEATPWERYRGRRMRRELFRSAEVAAWPGWASLRQLWRVKQTTEHDDGRCEVENRYFLTNLAWGRLSAANVLAAVRLHWGVENGCHWTLDVVLGEDRHPWCKQGRALRMLSWLRLIAYNALRMLRDRYLRSERSRGQSWDELRRLIVLTLTVGGVLPGLDTEAEQQATL
jgi:predicted transposase YbfD/YdcC